MPATEKTWRDQKLLHVVFAFSSLAMLLATCWMVGQDHNREWKTVQRKYRDVEQRLTSWKIQNEASTFESSEHARLESALLVAQSQPPAEELYMAFKREVKSDADARGVKSYDFESSNQSYTQLVELGETARSRRSEVVPLLQGLEQARQAVDQARQALTEDPPGIPEKVQALEAAQNSFETAIEKHRSTEEQALNAEAAAAKQRAKFLSRLDEIVKSAKFRETELARQRKFRSADLDAAKASLGLMVRDNKPVEAQQALQDRIDAIANGTEDGKPSVAELTRARDAATVHREQLQSLYKQMTVEVATVEKQLADNRAQLERLNESFDARKSTYFTRTPPFLGKKWLELPILSAFNSPLRIDNLWTDGLTQPNGSFGQVRRFDRCTTCHQAIEKTRPGSAVDPLYVPEHKVELVLETPSSPPTPEVDDQGTEKPLTLEQVYGLRIADRGLVDNQDVTVNWVGPESAAATARFVKGEPESPTNSGGLQVGDVLIYVNQDKVVSPEKARQFLIDSVQWGQPVTLTVRRGLPQPFTTHPRMDLFVGSLSPHKLSVMGCTVCHEGQGSATDFKYASHTPNDPQQGETWSDEHGWFNNHHWIYPMYPSRFAESLCLKCHHEVDELEPSDRFPDPPAPRLMQGYHLVEKFGCYGCHEINGYDGPDRRIGPDLRLEPNYSPAAATVQADPGFSALEADEQAWVRQLIQQPSADETRRALRDFLLRDAKANPPLLTARSHEMAAVLQDVDTPGTRRKVGPSLRYVDSKLGEPFLYDWIREPMNFRPNTQMPRFFGQWKHLSGADRELAENYEPLEILGIVKYLRSRSEPFEYLQREEVTESPSGERGKLLFETRGCLACHQHQDFPAAVSEFGPDLSNVGDKLSSKAGATDGAAWLYSWIKQPTHYNARSKMPDLYLLPIEDEEGNTTDPAADITAYLLESSHQWQPPQQSLDRLNPDKDELDNIVLGMLEQAFIETDAKRYLSEGIPENLRAGLKGAEVELVGDASVDAKLLYVGRKALGKYGCNGCHDIPGFEAAKPIGTAMADWGRKETSKLAFEHILEYLEHGGHAHHTEGTQPATQTGPDSHASDPETARAADEHAGVAGDGPNADSSFDESFYRHELNEHSRIGFIWQKLKEPRSYDYHKTANKRYDERLRMPLFPLSLEERESIVTFVLGLVADPPADQFVYQPDERAAARIAGRRVLTQFNCTGCHVMDPERWVIEFYPGDFDEPPETVDFPFVTSPHSPDALAASAQPHPQRGVLRAVLSGMPSIDNATGLPVVLDDEGDPVEEDYEYDPATLQHRITLWEKALIDGHTHNVGGLKLDVPVSMIHKKYPAFGGDLTRLLLPRVVELERQANPAANGTEAWSWLPPPLVGEGTKVQPEWLHSFLLDPTTIRPSVFLRMPRFNMSPEDATKLVNYFAARDDAEFPFEFADRSRSAYLTAAEAEFAATSDGGSSRLAQAMKIVTNDNYCVKCHLVGDFDPTGSDRAKAPNLADVGQRLRPDYVRRWIANPTRILPYTNMPVNVPFDGGIDQSIYPGSSTDQVQALTDLLMNFDRYMAERVKIAPLVGGAKDASGGESDESTESVRRVRPRDDEISTVTGDSRLTESTL